MLACVRALPHCTVTRLRTPPSMRTNRPQIAAQLRDWCADPGVDVVISYSLSTGDTAAMSP